MPSKLRASQEFVPIEEIRDGVVVQKNGSLAMVLLVSSINFALKSAEEQQGIIFQYQNFLNSLDFSIQLYIQSRRLDIRPYISLLDHRLKEQVNDLIKIQTREYIQFIKTFTDSTAIMTKTFFVVIPYDPPVIAKNQSMFSGLFGNKKNRNLKQKEETFEENRAQLEERAAVVAQGLSRCGVRALPLGTEELVELYYKIFNPGELDKPIPEAARK